MPRASRPGFILLLCLGLAGSASATSVPAARIAPEWVVRWRADLAFAADSLPKAHPAFFRHLSRADYEAELSSLADRLPTLSQAEAVVELGRIIVRVGDGHTRVTYPFDPSAGFFTGHATTAPPRIPDLVFRHYPLRFGLFGDSLHVTHATTADRELLGGRVVRLGELPAGEARAAIEPVIQRDNASQVRDLLPSWLVTPEILAARGVVADPERLRIVVERPGGGLVTRELAPVAPGTAVTWIAARTLSETPWRDRFPERAHWFAPVPGRQAIYARIREVSDDEGSTLAGFADSLLATFARARAGRLILDLRGNVGGDGSLNRPLLLGLIREPRLAAPGALWVLIDRGTFSAAVMLAADLEAWTPAILVGEMTGGDPNAPGDSRRIVLPETGITVRVSSLSWQLTDPRDRRGGITPHLPITPSYADWQAGRDPVLEAALAGSGRAAATAPAGAWTGTIAFEWSHSPVQFLLAPPAGASRGSVAMPGFGVPETPLDEVRADARGLAAAWTTGSTRWRLETVVAGERLVGHVAYRGRRLPVVLERVEPQGE